MSAHQNINIAVIGCGMWGRNIARNCAKLGVLTYVVDESAEKADEFAQTFSANSADFSAVCADQAIHGIMISASAKAHELLAIEALNAGKHVFVEKPMSLTLASAKAMNKAAMRAGRQLMIGHLIRYHPGFIELLAQVREGAVGKLRHIQANRLAMGRIRNTESALLDLCPHDLSLILELTGSLPTRVVCFGAAHITPGIVDVLSTGMGFANGVSADMTTSWINPIKKHELIVTGQTGSLMFDDTKPWPEKLTLFTDHITQAGEMFVVERDNPIHLPIEEKEPLKEEILAFIQVCQTGQPAPTNGDEGVAVQTVLEQMTVCLRHLNETSKIEREHR